MKGVFIPEITVEEFRNASLESVEQLMAEGTMRDVEIHDWIPCSERMPEQDGTYIVSGVWASGKKATGECEYRVEDGYFNASWSFDVRAWMPLPEPYEEENNG